MTTMTKMIDLLPLPSLPNQICMIELSPSQKSNSIRLHDYQVLQKTICPSPSSYIITKMQVFFRHQVAITKTSYIKLMKMTIQVKLTLTNWMTSFCHLTLEISFKLFPLQIKRKLTIPSVIYQDRQSQLVSFRTTAPKALCH